MSGRIAIAVVGLSLLSLGAGIAALLWPKYGLCFGHCPALGRSLG